MYLKYVNLQIYKTKNVKELSSLIFLIKHILNLLKIYNGFQWTQTVEFPGDFFINITLKIKGRIHFQVFQKPGGLCVPGIFLLKDFSVYTLNVRATKIF